MLGRWGGGGVGEIPKHSGSFVTINEALCRAKFTFDQKALFSARLTSYPSHIRLKYVLTGMIYWVFTYYALSLAEIDLKGYVEWALGIFYI